LCYNLSYYLIVFSLSSFHYFLRAANNNVIYFRVFSFLILLFMIFRLPIFTESPVKLSWAFRKSASSSRLSQTDDHGKIYMVNITNTLSGGAEICKRCPRGASGNG